MEQVLAFNAGRSLDLIHPGLKRLWSHVVGMGANAAGEFAENGACRIRSENRPILLFRTSPFYIESEDRSGLGGKLIEVVDCRNKQPQQLFKPRSNQF